MKKIHKKLRWLFLLASVVPVHAELYVREIPPLQLEMNQSYSLPLSPYVLFTGKPQDLTLRITKSKVLTAKYVPEKNSIILTPKQNWHGVEPLSLKWVAVEKEKKKKEEKELTLLVRIKKKSYTTFTYQPESPVKEVFIAGDFNGWNNRANCLQGPDAKGIFTISLPLSGGRYGYKFVADGKWLQDTKNPNAAPDGHGGFNSVIEVPLETQPRLFGIEKKTWWDENAERHGYGGVIEASFGFEPVKAQAADLDPSSIFVLLNGERVSKNFFSWSPSEQKLRLSLKNLPTNTYTVRIFAQDKSGRETNEIFFEERLGESFDFNWKDAVIYSIVTDRFYNGDKSNDAPIKDPNLPWSLNYQGGDWEGIIQKIRSGYFTDLGVNVLWISPVNDNPNQAFGSQFLEEGRKISGYHGYWPISLTQTEEHFGSMEKLKELVSVASQHNIRIMLDSVLNHIHEAHPLFKEKPHWFGTLELPDGRKNLRLFDERPMDTWFDVFLPDIDYENAPDAIDFMVENTLWWIRKTGAEGLRLDAVKHMPHSFWKALRKAINERIELPQNRIFYLVGETIAGRDIIAKFVGDDQLHGQFDFPLYWTIRDVFAWENADFFRLESDREKYERASDRALPSILLGNHDFPRFITFADGDLLPNTPYKETKEMSWKNPPKVDDPASYKKLALAFAFLFSQPGVPCLYYGDEIGLSGAGDPDNRRMMKFGAELSDEERKLLEQVKKFIRIRNQNPALRTGTHKTLVLEKDLYVYEKRYFQNIVVAGLNRARKPQTIEFGLPEVTRWKNLLDGSTVMTDPQGKVRFSLAPLGAAIFAPQ